MGWQGCVQKGRVQPGKPIQVVVSLLKSTSRHSHTLWKAGFWLFKRYYSSEQSTIGPFSSQTIPSLIYAVCENVLPHRRIFHIFRIPNPEPLFLIMCHLRKLLQLVMLSCVFSVFILRAHGQAPTGRKKQDNPSGKESKSFGDVMLGLGRGLVKEVSRRLNIEESEIVTIKPETRPDGGKNYRVATNKFSFTVRKKNKKNG